MSDNDPNDNIRRTVGFAVLRRMSLLARDEQTREADEARLVRQVALAIGAFALAGLAWLSVRIFA